MHCCIEVIIWSSYSWIFLHFSVGEGNTNADTAQNWTQIYSFANDWLRSIFLMMTVEMKRCDTRNMPHHTVVYPSLVEYYCSCWSIFRDWMSQLRKLFLTKYSQSFQHWYGCILLAYLSSRSFRTFLNSLLSLYSTLASFLMKVIWILRKWETKSVDFVHSHAHCDTLKLQPINTVHNHRWFVSLSATDRFRFHEIDTMECWHN